MKKLVVLFFFCFSHNFFIQTMEMPPYGDYVGGYDFDPRNGGGGMPAREPLSLLEAVEEQRPDCVEMFLKGANETEIRDALFRACEIKSKSLGIQHRDMIDGIMKKTANPSSLKKAGKTLLMVAAGNQSLMPLSYLLEKGIRSSSKDREGNTALMYALNKRQDPQAAIWLLTEAFLSEREAIKNKLLTFFCCLKWACEIESAHLCNSAYQCNPVRDRLCFYLTELDIKSLLAVTNNQGENALLAAKKAKQKNTQVLAPLFNSKNSARTRKIIAQALREIRKAASPDKDRELLFEFPGDALVNLVRFCDTCEKRMGSNYVQCSQCKEKFWCGKECAKIDWPVHKKLCIEVKTQVKN